MKVQDERNAWWVTLIGLAFGSYFMLRYQGYWAEIDSSVFVTTIEAFRDAHHLSYPGAYLHGYAYVVWVSTLSDFTGIPVPSLVQLYLPTLSTLMVALLGYAAFRRLLGSDRLGLITLGMLFLVPEFLFTVARGNHEKIDISMILLALLALVSSIREYSMERRWQVVAAWIMTFHLATFTLSTSNTFFGTTFAAALTLLLLGWAVLLRLRPAGVSRHEHMVKRLALLTATTWCLVMLVMWYAYPLAGSQLQTYKTMIGRLSSLFLSFETESNPYTAVSQEWVTPLAYRVVSSFRWFLFLTSLGFWISQIVHAFRRLDHTSTLRLLLLGLYGAFGTLLACGIPVDFLGLAEGSNLQVRLYTYFVLFAAPVFTLALSLWLRRLRAQSGRVHGLVLPALRVSVVAFALLSVMKATVDPLISNQWTFYLPQEVQAMQFWARHQRYASLWVGPRSRLDFAYAGQYATFAPNRNAFVSGDPDVQVEMALDSPVVRAQAYADRFGLPALLLGNRVYDNGRVQLIRRLPERPFDR